MKGQRRRSASLKGWEHLTAIFAEPGFDVADVYARLRHVGRAYEAQRNLDDDAPILVLRFGLYGGPPLTLAQIGQIYGLTHSAVDMRVCRAARRYMFSIGAW